MKPPEMLWSPTRGLLIKERGWWVRTMTAGGVLLNSAEWVNDLPDDTQTVWVTDEQWLRDAMAAQLGEPPTGTGAAGAAGAD